ncbi:ATP synthase F1 subunit epsilon [Candidatus Peregrinibacteria bacterium]|nr:ATP synthase F1 subunit epsilon [Candidatus Peregrinibacteria bacterium]
MKKLQFKIVTPERIVFEGAVDEVVMPTVDGEIAVLPNHIPLVTLSKAGVLRIKQGSEEIVMAVSGGIIEVDGKKVVVLADTAERADELEEAKIEKAREEAKRLMTEKRHDAEGFAEASAGLERELARLKVARKRHATHGGPRPTSE